MPETMTSGQEREAALIRLMEQYGGMLLNLCAVTLRDAAWARMQCRKPSSRHTAPWSS